MPQFARPILIAVAIVSCQAGCGKAAQPPAAPSAPQVVTEAAASAPLDVIIRAIGRVSAVDAVTLAPKIGGIITGLHIEDGAEVAQGALLVELDTAEAAASLREAQATSDNAKLDVDRAVPLARSGVVEASRLDQLRSALAIAEARVAEAQARLDDRRIYAPFPGRLGLRQVSVGALVGPGTPITSLTRMTPLKVTFSVVERELARLRVGQTVRVGSPAFGERSFTGQVSAIDPAIDPLTHTLAVQALLPNTEQALHPGLSVDVELVVEHLDAAVLVPERAVILQGQQAAVFVVDGPADKPVAKRLVVEVGARRDGKVQIRSGLEAGAPVVVEGLQSARDGAPVTPKATPTAPAPVAAAAVKG